MDEVNRLLNVGFIREVWFQTWVAKVVLVKKANKKWIIGCQLRRLEGVLEGRVSFTTYRPTRCCYYGFRTPEFPEDPHESWRWCGGDVILWGRCVMPQDDVFFGLKDASATYQRLINELFTIWMGQTMTHRRYGHWTHLHTFCPTEFYDIEGSYKFGEWAGFRCQLSVLSKLSTKGRLEARPNCAISLPSSLLAYSGWSV